jgi:signal transduction histidine kinase
MPCFLVALALMTGPLTVAAQQPLALRADTAPGDALGADVALAPPYLLLGAGRDQSDVAGAVYVFRQTPRGWLPDAKLVPPDPAAASGFGRSIALDGTTAVIGEPNHSDPLSNTGAVYIYERRATGQWHLTQSLSPPRPKISSYFGQVAIKGDTLLVGAIGIGGSVDRQGVVFVYARHRGGPDAWGLVTTLMAPDGAFEDWFGSALALDDDILLVGAPRHDANILDEGAVYVFQRDPDAPETWTLQAKLTASDGTSHAAFGAQVAIHGDLLLVGAPNADGKSPEAGAVYLFSRTFDGASDWHQVAKLVAQDGAPLDHFGQTIAVRDSLIVIGAAGHDGLKEDTGALYVFARPSSDFSPWKQVAQRSAPALEGKDAFAAAIAIRDTLLLVGAPGTTARSGAAYLYNLSKPLDSAWLFLDRFAYPSQGLPNSFVEASLQDREGFLWFGTHQGLHRFDGYSYKTYLHNPADSTTLSQGAILTLLEDRRGNYWIGTENGLNRFDPIQDRFIRYALPADSTYPRQSIRVLFEARDGVLWTGSNGRLYHYAPDEDRYKEYTPFTGPPERLDERYISGIQQDAAGRLWVLSKNLWENRASLYRIDLSQDAITRYPLSPDWGQVGPFMIDSEDRFWIKAPVPVSLPDTATVIQPREPPVAVAHWSFYEDHDGTVWAGTLAGLYRTHPASARLDSVAIGSATEAILHIYRDRSGRLLLSSTNGVYQVTSPLHEAEAAFRYTPPIALTGIQVSSREGTTSINPYGLKQLTLSHDDYSFAFEYAALTFAHAGQHRYRYRIKDFDKDWIEAGTRRFATYSNVPPGRYVFEVALEAADDSLSASRLLLPLVIKPAFWQTAWFQGSVLLLVLGLLAFGYRYRVRRLLEMERLRLRIASDLHDDVSSNLSGIALMSALVQQEPDLAPGHRHQLARIANTAQQTVTDLRDIVWLVDPSHDHLEDLLLKMKDTAAMLLNGTAYTFHIKEADGLVPLDMTFRRQVFLIFKEILHNIARHAEASTVTVVIGQQHKIFALQVTDDGVGFDPDAVQQGHGLRNLHRRAEMLGGHLDIGSVPGEGTRVSLTVKMA